MLVFSTERQIYALLERVNTEPWALKWTLAEQMIICFAAFSLYLEVDQVLISNEG